MARRTARAISSGDRVLDAIEGGLSPHIACAYVFRSLLKNLAGPTDRDRYGLGTRTLRNPKSPTFEHPNRPVRTPPTFRKDDNGTRGEWDPRIGQGLSLRGTGCPYPTGCAPSCVDAIPKRELEIIVSSQQNGTGTAGRQAVRGCPYSFGGSRRTHTSPQLASCRVLPPRVEHVRGTRRGVTKLGTTMLESATGIQERSERRHRTQDDGH